jgi:hypothetical protein
VVERQRRNDSGEIERQEGLPFRGGDDEGDVDAFPRRWIDGVRADFKGDGLNQATSG